MKTIIIGNGIDLQYGGAEYSNIRIIQRAFSNIETGNFRTIDYPASIIDHLNSLFELTLHILRDPCYIENKVWTDVDRKALDSFLSRYNSKSISEPSQIGFEDYFLIQRLFFNLHSDNHTGNVKERTEYFDCLRRFFLDAIYNEGRICDIDYPSTFGLFLSEFNNIFSLNYDRNIEKVTTQPIGYLHGAFHVISEKFDNSSPMNRVMGIYTDVAKHEYLYSTALTTYCGKEKEKLLLQADNVNSFLALALRLEKECERTGTPIYPHIKAIIKAHELCPKYKYPQNYCYDMFERISGEITILGVSPTNDDHLIDVVNKNIDHITYYYYPKKDDDTELELIKCSFPRKAITFLDVTELWSSL